MFPLSQKQKIMKIDCLVVLGCFSPKLNFYQIEKITCS